tara:strand:+ start:672 stop:818 length:147 start_codon:yes stop_codon:yes gene_type:complete
VSVVQFRPWAPFKNIIDMKFPIKEIIIFLALVFLILLGIMTFAAILSI